MSKNTTARDSGDVAQASRAGAPASSSSNHRIKKDCATCGSPASQKCRPCLNYGVRVYYCSKACQRSDWKDHKKICGPESLPRGAPGGDGGPNTQPLIPDCVHYVGPAAESSQHRNAMAQLLERMSGLSLPEMPTAAGRYGFNERTGEWDEF